MNSAISKVIRVFCVDDNYLVTQALKLQLDRTDDIEWAGSAPDADALLTHVRDDCPDIVLLDIDMPGKNAFVAIGELMAICSGSRVVMYTGLMRAELVNRALDAGAWGFVAKIDGEKELISAIRAVASGSMGFSGSIRKLLDER